MTRQPSLRSLNLQALTDSSVPLTDRTPLHLLERLANEIHRLEPDFFIDWQVKAELRPGASGPADTWLQLRADTTVSLVCQRCMGPAQTQLHVDRWYRFVDTEDIAMAEDDASEEDLLVMAPQFDLLALLEDELLMALPLVPMHDECPVLPAFSAGALEADDPSNDVAQHKPHPFAALAQLKKK